MTTEQKLDKARLEHIGAQTVSCEICNKTGVPLFEFWDDGEPLCAACLIRIWEESLPNDDVYEQVCRQYELLVVKTFTRAMIGNDALESVEWKRDDKPEIVIEIATVNEEQPKLLKLLITVNAEWVQDDAEGA